MDKRVLQDHVDDINNIIEGFLPVPDGYNSELAEAMRYSVNGGGKRLRPMFMQEVFRMFSEGREEPLILHAFMSAIEFIHTYSLIHDDLPAMDNDEYRRGQLTSHVKYGEAAAILAGDALLNHAFEIIFTCIEESEDPEDYMAGISAARVLSSKAGMSGMIGGQYIDVYSEKHPDFTVDKDVLNYIYRNKTSALIEAAFMAGAIIGGAADIEISVVEKMATYIGLAFQIQDDILDVEGDSSVLGKPVGSDEKNDRQTFVSLYGLEKAREAVRTYTDRALEIFDKLRHKNVFLRELIILLISREN
ncbi:MAG: polyprenyl synthetase family protein [Parasporobacterium sp.]|nr:polyprenyl synthetase family protein [Parasporobacterium sp.]